jgi:hypothetical protein
MPAASNSRLASLPSEIRRSAGVIPRSFVVPNGMLIWREAARSSTDVGGVFIALLPNGHRTTRGASSETASDQQPMQFSQRRYRDAWCTQFHSGAGGGIEHPCRHHDNDTGRDLDVNDFTAGAPLEVLTSNTASVQSVPAVVNLDLLPDMGRMTA